MVPAICEGWRYQMVVGAVMMGFAERVEGWLVFGGGLIQDVVIEWGSCL